ncbi:hypothetical protein AAW14_06055 [Streptomyces hygroscopicus]|uniref:DUF6197 family protein n=1 Tax=Streptomyces hygroscopicus TaxID=1912 RepID=UPI00223FB700|nr:hypothetical protein [Streptomyces hygroscopicus]MCW7941609.1 hypothetical protein [Streptomyces hygroscopicus]
MSLAEIYLKAADIIRTNGHAKGDFYNIPESQVGVSLGRCEWPVCAAGALSIVVFGDPLPPREGQDGRTEFDAVVARLNARIEDFHLYGFEGEPPVLRLAGWNDADERTPADVIAAFERTAREVA